MASGWPGDELAEAMRGYHDLMEWLPGAIGTGRSWMTPDPDPSVLGALDGLMESEPRLRERVWRASMTEAQAASCRVGIECALRGAATVHVESEGEA